jgi:hypothetical protein
MPPAVRVQSGPRLPFLLGAIAGAVAVGIGFELVRPFAAGPVGFDSSASVVYFDRIVAGRHLEAFVTATPKPFLTVVFGLLHGLTADWRSISWATIGAFALCVVLGGWFAWRIGGPIAGVFVVVGLLGSRTLLADVVISYAVPWAMVGWLVAALALTADRRRPALAGVALGLATLARLETLVVVGLALVVVLVTARPVRRAAPRETLRWWLLAVAMLALPIMLIHDWLLTGDPMYWVSVPEAFSRGSPDAVLSPADLTGAMTLRYLGMPVLTGLGVIGFVVLARRRAWVPLLGLLGMTLGIAAFLELLAIRNTYVSARYYAAIDLGLLMAAAVGAAAALEGGRRVLARVTGRSEAGGRAGLVAAAAMTAGGVALALASIWPVASISATFRTAARTQLLQAEHADHVLPALAAEVTAVPGAGTFPAPDAPMSGDPADLVVLVPPLERPRLAVDLSLPLTQITSAPPAWLKRGPGFLPYGDVIFHDELADRGGIYNVLEVDSPTTVGHVTLTPIVADPAAGLWVQRIQR